MKKVISYLPYVLCIVAVYLTLSAYFPGAYLTDPILQLKEIQSRNMTDWHPPLMAWFWSKLIRITGRIESLFLFNLGLLFAGACAWVYYLKKNGFYYLSFFIPLLILTPVITSFSGTMLKDVGFAFGLFFSTGLLACLLPSDKFFGLKLLIAFAAASYSFGFRINGVFGVFPVVFYISWVLLDKLRWKVDGWRTVFLSFVISVGLMIVMVVPIQLFTGNLVKKPNKSFPFQYTQLYDLAGIYYYSGKSCYPDYVKEHDGFNLQLIKDEYEHSLSDKKGAYGNINRMIWTNRLVPLHRKQEIQEKLNEAWMKAIISNPYAYLEHRSVLFNSLMSRKYFSQVGVQSRVELEKKLTFWRVNAELSRAKLWGFPIASRYIDITHKLAKQSFLYSGWFWLVILFAQLLLACKIDKHARPVLMMLSLSGVFYLLPYYVVTGASDFRYIFWSSVSGTLGLILLTTRLHKFLFGARKQS